ncbi:hypothetical protein Rhal01_02399 [Rubritalea halochordaticola]|uniref:Porin n=1 Tax=Rubritalea halochordaticola TaxID=714537 RepID=A0ABP9V4F1_9BACT
MDKKVLTTIVGGIALAGVANAGTVEVPAPAPSSPCGDWCECLKEVGKLYKNKSNPFIQEFKFFGRAQYQWGYTDGEVDGEEFNAQGDELRRLRLGAQVKFLNNFKLKGNINLEQGGFRNHEFGYNNFDELKLTYSLGSVGGFDDLALTYGRQKFTFSQEAHTSSKKIKTVERSNIANFFYNSARPTGLTLSGKSSGFDFGFSVYSSDIDEAIGNWDDGQIYLLNLGFEAAGGEFGVDLAYNDVDADDDDDLNFEWGTSVSYTTDLGNWELMVNGLYGQTQDSDAVYGLVIMPSTYIIEDKLEFVARYQYFGADEQDVKINSRNVRNAAKFDDLSVAKGDENHSLYAGLNYYFCGHNSKLMTGVEYETLDGEDAAADVEATTFWLAYRMYF